MAPRKKAQATADRRPGAADLHVKGLKSEVQKQSITDTLKYNYMPYAMSVIISRAIPEIDGFKPSHRKLLYTMYQMHLLGGARTKSANIVGATMKLNPHGDAAIYDTMVRLSKGYGALLHPFVDSKGNFGKVYSRDMAWAASRYTEARLDGICGELFRDIDQDTVDFVDNYDGKLKEPSLLPTTFPNILVSANKGIAVGMASDICGFNLGEVCDTTVALMENPNHDILSTLLAPDLPTGGELLYDEKALREIYETGRGTFKVRAKWRYIQKENVIEVYEIPYSTTTEAIVDKVVELVKLGKLKEISDIRDETDLSGLKLAIDLKRGAAPEKTMQKLFKMTPLLDSQSCNFNVLINGQPRVMGVRKLLNEWVTWRMECVRRRLNWSIARKSEKLHLLQGLEKILLNINKAIKIIRETEKDADVVPNLMTGFKIDDVQAEFVANMRLRDINKEHILKRTKEIATLEKEIHSLETTVKSNKRIQNLIAKELREVKEKYGMPRRTEIVRNHQDEVEDDVDDGALSYPVHLFLSQEGYLKKITPQSLRMANEQKYKDGDGPGQQWEADNRDELMVFTDKQQCYKTFLSEFDDSKASVLGDYLPTKLGMDTNEKVLWACLPGDYSGDLVFFFENGKAARVSLAAYQTQTRRKKLISAFSDKSPLVKVLWLKEDQDLAVSASSGKTVLFDSSLLAAKSSRAAQGVGVLTLKKGQKLAWAAPVSETSIKRIARYRVRNIPAAGVNLIGVDVAVDE